MVQTKGKLFSGSVLKLLAVISMIIDHGALILLPALSMPTVGGVSLYEICRKVGRLAFPIFCFLVAEGYFHTRNKRKYGLSLLLFAVLSEIPFDLMLTGRLFDTGKQNVYFTLLLGVLMIHFHENTAGFRQILLMLAVGIVTIALDVDYGIRGVILILLLYVLRDRPVTKTALAYPMLSGGFAAWAAFLPIGLYNGKRGFILGPWLKYGFYVFYPVHILALLFVKTMLERA